MTRKSVNFTISFSQYNLTVHNGKYKTCIHTGIQHLEKSDNINDHYKISSTIYKLLKNTFSLNNMFVLNNNHLDMDVHDS